MCQPQPDHPIVTDLRHKNNEVCKFKIHELLAGSVKIAITTENVLCIALIESDAAMLSLTIMQSCALVSDLQDIISLPQELY